MANALEARPATVQLRTIAATLAQRHGSRTSLPDALKSGSEALSGIAMDDVRVHRNSSEPAQMQAHAFAQGTDIHLAPGQEQHLPHEAWHVVQQKQGRVAATRQRQGGVSINDDAGLEGEADAMGARAASSLPGQTVPPQHVGVSGAPPLQAKWRNTNLTDEFFQWDRALQGLRWYAGKHGDAMYFIVESLNDENRHLIKFEGQIRSFGEWLETDAFRVLAEDNSVDGEAVGPQLGHNINEHIPPHVFRPVKHAFNEESGKVEVTTAPYVKLNQKAFEQTTGAATKASGAGRPIGEENPKLKHAGNVGRYVHHLTTLGNLMMNPGGGGPGTGIIARGLDPSKGGGKGGACETCVVLDDQEMYDGSKAGSKNVVAITTSATNVKMYTNQRHEHTAKEFAASRLGVADIMLREPILLRFRLTAAHIASMQVDPMHPKDDTVRLLVGQQISPAEIEALTSDGWVPISNVAAALGAAFGVAGVAGAASADASATAATSSTSGGNSNNRHDGHDGTSKYDAKNGDDE